MEVYVRRIEQVCSAQGIFIRTIVDMYWIKKSGDFTSLQISDIIVIQEYFQTYVAKF